MDSLGRRPVLTALIGARSSPGRRPSSGWPTSRPPRQPACAACSPCPCWRCWLAASSAGTAGCRSAPGRCARSPASSSPATSSCGTTSSRRSGPGSPPCWATCRCWWSPRSRGGCSANARRPACSPRCPYSCWVWRWSPARSAGRPTAVTRGSACCSASRPRSRTPCSCSSCGRARPICACSPDRCCGRPARPPPSPRCSASRSVSWSSRVGRPCSGSPCSPSPRRCSAGC